MELRSARLCLDCEEVHTDQKCPVCASGTSPSLPRWIPLEDRPQIRRPPPPPPPSGEPRNTSSLRWARRGAAGVALVAVSQWLWRNARPVEWGDSGPGDDEPAK